jgi:hypothetical protein
MLALMLRNYNTLEDRSFKEWSSILDLSTRWGFPSIRDLAVRCIKPPNSLNRLLLARKHDIEQWVLPALLELCQRPEPLGLEEACLMDFEDVVLVGSVRQTVRSPTLMVQGAEIRNCIRAWKRGEPWSPVSDPPDVPTGWTLRGPRPIEADLPHERNAIPPPTMNETPPPPPIGNEGGGGDVYGWGQSKKKKGKPVN